MKVTVFGVGYVGLVQAAVLADAGNDVICVDVDAAKIADLNAGIVPIYEPDLDELVRRGLNDGELRFTTDARAGVTHGSVLFIAVGTPTAEDGSADLRYVLSVAKSIGAHIDEPRVIATKSTVPVGTADKVRATITDAIGNRPAPAFHVVANPEFLKEGAAVADCQRPERIIVGTDSPEAERVLRELYAPFSRNHDKMIVMDARSAELTKYAANAMLATKISFMNEMAAIAERLGADIEWVRKGIGSDPRIGYDFIYPGVGYGGSCFPKDMRALLHTAEAAGVTPHVLSAVEARNAAQKTVLIDKIVGHFGDVSGKTFALWGLAFKPNTDDMREAPSRAIMESLWTRGARIRAFDPKAMAECKHIYGERPDLLLAATKEEALEGADALIVATEWKMFRSVELAAVKAALRQPVIFDGRNIYDPGLAEAAGLIHFGVGRGRS
jgi:UDPglucose 6-dehydrogenase